MLRDLVNLWIAIASVSVQSTSFREVNLTTSNNEQNGANVILLKDTTVDTVDNEWNINVTDHAGFHMQIDLDNKWGFHPNKSSNITLIIYSRDIIDDTDSDLLFAFSVGNAEYVSMLLRFDNDQKNNQIHPNCSGNFINTENLASGNIKTTVASNNGKPRYRKLLGDLRDSDPRIYFLPENIMNNKSEHYPIIITLQNDPINDYLIVLHSNPIWLSNGFIQKCVYNSFVTQQGLQIYIAGDNKPETHSIYQFSVQYSIDSSILNEHIYSTTNETSNYPTDLSTTITKSITSYDTSYYTHSNRDNIWNSQWFIVVIISICLVIIALIFITISIVMYKRYKRQPIKKNVDIELTEFENNNENIFSENVNTYVNKQKTDSNDTECESLYESQHNIEINKTINTPFGTKPNEKYIEGEGEKLEEYENNTEYHWIEIALKKCDDKDWERFLYNFKHHKMTVDRLEHIITANDNQFWQQLIPQLGVRLEFISLWKQQQINISK